MAVDESAQAQVMVRGQETKNRIIEAAEQLVARDGFDRVSLRDITAAARVNLAAVHYHFGSKDALIDTLLARYIQPLNLERTRQLDAAEAAFAPKPVPLDQLIDALIRPAIELQGTSSISGILFFKMMSRCADQQGRALPPDILHSYQQTIVRFIQAIRRVLPDLPERAISWRIHFVFGAVNHSLANGEHLDAITLGRAGKPVPEQIIRRLVTFATAGFRAADPEPDELEEVMATDLR